MFVSKPGLPNWDHVSPATSLLADAIQVAPGARVLVLGCGHGALGAALGRALAGGKVVLSDTNFVALQMADLTIQANALANVSTDGDLLLGHAYPADFDAVVVELPTGRKLARRWLLDGHAALRTGGVLYVAGPNKEGIQPAIDDARELFGNVALLGYKASNRVARACKESSGAAQPAWAAEPGIAPGSWHEFDAELGSLQFHLRSLPGIFAYDKLDAGTALLLSALRVPRGAQALDIGCGSGMIGLAMSRLGAAHVDMVDVNLLAVSAARENIVLNAAAQAVASPSDVTSAVVGNRYDLIVSNPPFHAGKTVDYDVAQTIIADAPRLLAPGGRLVLVANRFIRYDRVLEQRFKTVHVLAADNRFHVLEGRL